TVTGKVSRNKVETEDGETNRFRDDEAGRLQSFPMDYPWEGGAIAQQIGNAVPPIFGLHVLSAALGRQVTREEADKVFALDWAEVSPAMTDRIPDVLADIRRRVRS